VVAIQAAAIPEVQQITVSYATSGYFFLELDTSNFGGSDQYSGYIEVNYPADNSLTQTYGRDVANIISSMGNVRPYGSVTVTHKTIDANNYAYLVTFPVSMGDVPQMKVHYTALQPAGTATSAVTTVTEGNIVGGTFKLSFEGKTTESISCDATADDVRVALEKLSTIGTVQVTRSQIDYQQAYKWTVTFSSPQNAGNVAQLTTDPVGLTTTNAAGPATMSVSSTDGNELAGTFTLQFVRGALTGTSGPISFAATASEFQTALVSMTNNVIPPGTVSVSRSNPDGQKGYTWTVSFLPDFARTFYGPQNPFTYNKALLTGSSSNINVVKARVGSIQEVQQIEVTSPAPINTSMVMQLTFNGQTTIPIKVVPSNGVCDSKVVEVQTITTSTHDNSQLGQNFEVSMYLQFRLAYGKEVTGWIDANPSGTPDCSKTAADIKKELELLDYFNTVTVTPRSISAAQDCEWTVSFVSSIGNLNQLTVQARNPIKSVTGALGFSSTAGVDTVTTATTVNGEKNAIQAALELLNNVGSVTVTPVTANQGANGQCTWKVTFDSNAGNLNSMQVQLFTSPNGAVFSGVSASQTLNNVQVVITEITPGTSTVIAGNFALTFRGARSVYVPYNSDARTIKNILEDLPTIGEVEVNVGSADENNGYTWMVTFLTNLGSLDLIEFDNRDMTGTVVNGKVSKQRVGIAPPFNSLDQTSNLPLGSVVVTDLSNLAVTVDELDQGIAYYFRVSAINSVGQGPYAFSSVPYAIPQPQRPGRPINPTLNAVDGSSLEVGFKPPALNGGQDITFYKVRLNETYIYYKVLTISIF
jgi:hypothetical protein